MAEWHAAVCAHCANEFNGVLCVLQETKAQYTAVCSDLPGAAMIKCCSTRATRESNTAEDKPSDGVSELPFCCAQLQQKLLDICITLSTEGDAATI